MKVKSILFAVFVISFVKLAAQTPSAIKTQVTSLSIVPQPTKLTPVTGTFTITNRTQIIVPNGNSDIRDVAQAFADRFKLDGTKVSVIDIND